MLLLRSLLAALLLSAAPVCSLYANDGAAVKPAKALITPKATAKGLTAKAQTQTTKPVVRPLVAVAPTTPAAAKPAEQRFAITVSGSVIGADGLPLIGATVWNSRSREVLAVTNAEGEFLLELPSNAPVVLTCGFAGCTDQKIELSRPHRLNEVVVSLLAGPARPRR